MDLLASRTSNVNSLKRTLDEPPLEETTQKRAKTPVPAKVRLDSSILRMAMVMIIVDSNRTKEFPRIINDKDHWAELLRSPASDGLAGLLGEYFSSRSTMSKEELQTLASLILGQYIFLVIYTHFTQPNSYSLEQLVTLYEKEGLNRSLDDTVVANKMPLLTGGGCFLSTTLPTYELFWFDRSAEEVRWAIPFAGKSKDRLYRKIKAIVANKEKATGPNSRILPILQSSGMGKSRLVDEMAREVFTIPLCLREPNVSGEPSSFKNIDAILRFNRLSAGRHHCGGNPQRIVTVSIEGRWTQWIYAQISMCLVFHRDLWWSWKRPCIVWRQNQTAGVAFSFGGNTTRRKSTREDL